MLSIYLVDSKTKNLKEIYYSPLYLVSKYSQEILQHEILVTNYYDR